MSFPRNYKIMDVELNYARLATAQKNPFGGPDQWELQIATRDKTKADELRANHFNVKEKDGVFTVSLKRKTVKASGEANVPVRVVDAATNPIENVSILGNGSRGNVIVFQYEYEDRVSKTTKVASSLTAVQVVDFKEYRPDGADFDVIETGATPEVTEESAVF